MVVKLMSSASGAKTVSAYELQSCAAPSLCQSSVRRHSSEASLAHVASLRSLSELSEGDASVSSLIRHHVSHAALISRGPAELAFRLPKEDSSKQVFSSLMPATIGSMHADSMTLLSTKHARLPHHGDH